MKFWGGGTVRLLRDVLAVESEKDPTISGILVLISLPNRNQDKSWYDVGNISRHGVSPQLGGLIPGSTYK
ncbi:hypothetical protein H8E77_30990 [bacterium]|nr:hypothetical protein [bacterium]